jgi:hypothetical protein
MKCIACEMAGRLRLQSTGNILLHGFHLGIIWAGKYVAEGMPPSTAFRIAECATSLCKAHREQFIASGERVTPAMNMAQEVLEENVTERVTFVTTKEDDDG